MRRGRLSRYIEPTVLYMGELTTTDCYVSAYYLYRISEMLAGAEEQFEYQVALFFKLAIRLKCTQAISDYLEKMVEKAEKDGKLSRIPFPDFLPHLIADFFAQISLHGKRKDSKRPFQNRQASCKSQKRKIGFYAD